MGPDMVPICVSLLYTYYTLCVHAFMHFMHISCAEWVPNRSIYGTHLDPISGG
jgi:hypothetical protein